MNLYNSLFGRNPASGLLLQLLGTTEEQVPRFRDVFVTDQFIVIHTRTGGGNRAAYEAQNAYLRTLPGFDMDVDDVCDCTYADFYYKRPEHLKEILDKLIGETPRDKFNKLMAALNSPEDTELKREAMEVGKKILAPVIKALGESRG